MVTIADLRIIEGPCALLVIKVLLFGMLHIRTCVAGNILQ